MKTLKILNDDLVIESGDFVFLEDDNELLQSLERRLTTKFAEFFLEPSMGLDYESIHVKNPSDDEIRTAIGDCLSQDERIISVDEVNVTLNTDRTATINFKATATTGTIEGEVVV